MMSLGDLVAFLQQMKPQTAGSAQTPVPSGGMLGGASSALVNRQAYLAYVQQQQEAGMQPLPYPQWAQMQMMQAGGMGGQGAGGQSGMPPQQPPMQP